MTMRSLLSDINKIYDPIGFIIPVLIKRKIFLQQLWLLKLSLLPHDLQDHWKHFYIGLKVREDLVIPRRIFYSFASLTSIHGFSVASQETYDACMYLWSSLPNESCITSMYTSKSRVAPMYPTSIPRFELSSA